MNNKLLKIHSTDNVAVALTDLPSGTTCTLEDKSIVTTKDLIPFGHKVATEPLEKDENIIKYGQPIGHAITTIIPGQHVHTNNIKTNLEGILDYTYCPDISHKQTSDIKNKKYFNGYVRDNGSVGVRNEIWIIPTVGCVNTTAEKLAAKATELI